MKYLKSALAACVTIAVAGICGTHSASAQMVYPTPDTKTLQLKGPVKQMTEYCVSKNEYFTDDELKDYKRRGVKPPTTKREFDKSYQFDKRGFITSKREDFLGSDDLLTKTYDAEGRILSEKLERDGVPYTLYTFNYDSEGMPSGARKIDADGKVIFTETNRVTRNGDTVLQTNIHANTDGTGTESVIEFWPNGAMESMTISSGNRSTKFTFDSDGNPLTYEINQNGTAAKMRMTKDPSDPDVTLTYCKAGNGPEYLQAKKVNDSHGNTVRNTTYLPDGTVDSDEELEYIYDSHGNWTRKTWLKGAKYDIVAYEREITYYL